MRGRLLTQSISVTSLIHRWSPLLVDHRCTVGCYFKMCWISQTAPLLVCTLPWLAALVVTWHNVWGETSCFWRQTRKTNAVFFDAAKAWVELSPVHMFCCTDSLTWRNDERTDGQMLVCSCVHWAHSTSVLNRAASHSCEHGWRLLVSSTFLYTSVNLHHVKSCCISCQLLAL